MNPQVEVKDITYRIPHTCLFNFVMYTEEESKIAYLNNLADKILRRFPSRIVVIYGDRDRKEDLLDVFEDKLTNCDSTYPRSNVIVSGKRLEELPLITLPFLVPDYPIYSLWSGNPTTQNPNLDFFKTISLRLIFDSETCDNLKLFADKMLCELKKTTLETIDANWARIAGWRLVLMELVDSPSRLELFNTCLSIEICYAGPSRQQALYLQAWLASRLHWKCEKCTDETIISSHEGHTFDIHLKSVDKSTLPSGSIISIKVNDRNGAMISATKKEGSPQVLVHIASTDSCELPFTLYLPDLYRGNSFFTNLLWSKENPQYGTTLELLSKTVE